MTYATEQNLVDRFGSAAVLALADRDQSGSNDPAVIAAALADADDLVNSYLAGRYALPLSVTPGVLTTHAATIAYYKLHGDDVTDKVRKDYEDTLAWLAKVAKGEIELEAAGVEPTAEPSDIQISAPDRVFSRDTLADF